MPLVHRSITPVKLSSAKLELKGKYECEFVAVSNGTLVNVLRQLAALVNHAADIFSETATLTEKVGKRIRTVKLRLDELEAKTELFDPKLVPVPEGNVDDVSISTGFSREVFLETKLFNKSTRPRFLSELFDKAGSHRTNFPPHSPVPTITRKSMEQLLSSADNKRPASFAALRDWKLDDYLDEKIATLDKKKESGEALKRALASPFPSQLVQVDVTGQVFDRMKRNRRSLVIHTKRIKRSKRRNTICGSMPNKECGIQTSFSSVNCPPKEEVQKKYGIDSGHWSSTSSAQGGAHSTTSAPSPWDPTSLSTSSDFLFDDEDRCLTPQLEHFTDGLVSDSDSVDTDGYFTSFRSDCGFPKSKKSPPEEGSDLKEESEEKDSGLNANSTTESEYDLFGKGSTSTTASSCGTVVLRNKPNPPARTTSADHVIDKKSQSQDDIEWEERVKRKSLIERVPSLVVVTPSPSCSSESPPPLKDPGLSSVDTDSDRDSGRITPKAEDLLHGTGSSECGTLSDTDSELRGELRPASTTSSNGTVSSGNSTLTLTTCSASTLPRPDVIPDVQIIRTKANAKLDVSREYFSLDTVLLTSSSEEERRQLQNTVVEIKTNNMGGTIVAPLEKVQSPPGSATSGKIRGARVVLDANGEIIFASETLRRKRKPKVSFDPGNAVKTMDYDNFASTYGRIRESVYDRIRKDAGKTANENEKLYECIEEIRKQNLRHPYLHLQEEKSISEIHQQINKGQLVIMENGDRCSSSSSNGTTSSKDSASLARRYATRPPLSPPTEETAKINMLLETDLDSAIPPSMPDLKNLPKIKDRLKRNESYRIANKEEVNGENGGGGRQSPTTRPVLISLSPISNKLNRRMSFASSSKDGLPNGNLHLNKKRDILEEDPVFIQQILNNMSSNLAKSPSSPCSGYNSRITLSKLALSPEDRPTFLRRENDETHDPIWIAESPPTMDDIAKEIYRFRKKFNIQPNATSRNLLPSPSSGTLDFNGNQKGRESFRQMPSSRAATTPRSGTPQLDRNGNMRILCPNSSTIPIGFPKLEVQYNSSKPLSYSTPIKPSVNPRSACRMDRFQITPDNNNSSCSTLFSRPMSSLCNYNYSNSNNANIVYYDSPRASISSMNNSNLMVNTPPPPPLRNFSSSGRRIFPTATGAFNTSLVDYYASSKSNSNQGWGPASGINSGRYKRMSLAEPSSNNSGLSLGSRTSLNDFKKLLQSAKPKKNSMSAMEALKPKIAIDTTM